MSRAIKSAIAFAALLVILIAGHYWRFEREIPVRTVAAEQNVEVRVFGIGTIEAQVLSKVGFQIAGKVVGIEADQGDFVKAGAMLAISTMSHSTQRSRRAKPRNGRLLRTWPRPKRSASAPK
jgi:HlyD family secretion protein